MRRIYRLVFLTFVSLLFLFQSIVYSSLEETYFVITAYYSPLPDQSTYLNGSYAAEIRMNGKGTNGASGKEVFEWMLAAPSNYPFGTKIYFEWFGIGEVHDRGGAIVKASDGRHGYDRIDIWMGYGDEWLARARTWGIRTVKGKIVVPSSQNSITFGGSKLGNMTGLKVTPESEWEPVERLQEIFTKAGLYSWEIDGDYSSIEQSLLEFQIQSGIVTDAEDWWAGYFWKQTILALTKRFGSTSPLIEEPIEKFSEFNHVSQSKIYKIILDYGELEIGPESETEDIRLFQEFMREIGEYSWSLDGNYKSIEKNLLSLQKKVGVIQNDSDWGAGYFWSKTKTAIWEYYGTHDFDGVIQIEENTSTKTPQIQSTLSNSQKQKLDTVVITLKKQIQKISQKNGKTIESITQNLKSQITEALPRIQDSIIQEKLRYIGEQL